MGKSYVDLIHDASITADCSSIFTLIEDKAKNIIGNDYIETNYEDGQLCLLFKVDGEKAKVNIDKLFWNLAELLINDIASDSSSLEIYYENDDIEYDEGLIVANGTVECGATMETWAATSTDPESTEVYDSGISLHEKKSREKAKQKLENLSIAELQSLFVDAIIPDENASKETFAVEKEISFMKFTDEELRKAFSEVSFSWDASEDYTIKEN